jgi:hypothetical protein
MKTQTQTRTRRYCDARYERTWLRRAAAVPLYLQGRGSMRGRGFASRPGRGWTTCRKFPESTTYLLMHTRPRVTISDRRRSAGQSRR